MMRAKVRVSAAGITVWGTVCRTQPVILACTCPRATGPTVGPTRVATRRSLPSLLFPARRELNPLLDLSPNLCWLAGLDPFSVEKHRARYLAFSRGQFEIRHQRPAVDAPSQPKESSLAHAGSITHDTSRSVLRLSFSARNVYRRPLNKGCHFVIRRIRACIRTSCLPRLELSRSMVVYTRQCSLVGRMSFGT
ncbi:hypothetical protein LX36DRAFT_464879 [Colletotrichum falcatum]|nr:hypothetical protein LX36DRAFT_464879 [Colletotrichum falcatum]